MELPSRGAHKEGGGRHMRGKLWYATTQAFFRRGLLDGVNIVCGGSALDDDRHGRQKKKCGYRESCLRAKNAEVFPTFEMPPSVTNQEA